MSNFHIIFKTHKDKKHLESSLEKNPNNYQSIHDKTNIYEQKPINIGQFNEIAEAEVKERVEKRKQKDEKLLKKLNS